MPPSNDDLEEDYYALLGVSSRATPAELRHAYRNLARKYHPDLNPSPEQEEIFLKITNAFKTLSNPEKRNEYNKEHGHNYALTTDLNRQEVLIQATAEKDKHVSIVPSEKSDQLMRSLREQTTDADLKLGHKIAMVPQDELQSPIPEGEAIAPWGEEEEVSEKDEAEGSSFFSRILSRLGFSQNKKSYEADKARLRRQLHDAAQPLARTSPTTAKQSAPTLASVGNANINADSLRGERILTFQLSVLEAALGTSRELAFATGRDSKNIKARIKIPPGIESGALIEVTRGWDRIKARINIVEEPYLSLTGINIHLRLPVTLGEITKGAEIEIPTLEGHLRLAIPPNTSLPHVFPLAGYGLKSSESDASGELCVEPYLAPPNKVTDALLAAVELLEKNYDGPPRDIIHDLSDPSAWQEDFGYLVQKLPVSFSESINGAHIDILSPEGAAKVTLPKNWKYGLKLPISVRYAVLPYIIPPQKISPESINALNAIEEHYLSSVRKDVPRTLLKE